MSNAVALTVTKHVWVKSLQVVWAWCRKGPFIASQLNSTQLDVELSTRSQREQLSPINERIVVTQLTQFVGCDVINKNTTDFAVRCSTGSVELSWVVSLSDTTQLNSTRRRVELSWVVSLYTPLYDATALVTVATLLQNSYSHRQ